jgi:hypothetical protein
LALRFTPPPLPAPLALALLYGAIATAVLALVALLARVRARLRRRYVRLRVTPYRSDEASAEGIVSMFEALHKRLLRRWWRRLLGGQPSVGLEVHCDRCAWLSLTCPAGLESHVEAALRGAYPNCLLEPAARAPGPPPCVVRLHKHSTFIKRAKVVDRFAHERAPAVNRLITTMAACGEPVFVQIALTPVPALFEGHAKRAYKRHEKRLSRARKLRFPVLDRSMVEDAELKGGLEVQHRPLFFADVRVVGPSRGVCERIASELRAATAENRLVERGTALRHGWLGLYTRRVLRGEGNPLPRLRKGVFASTELAGMWHMPSLDYSSVPLARGALPLAPASPAIMRPREGMGALRDAHGPVSIHPRLRRQNTAVTGAAGQGKSSYLLATVAEDLRRERCAVIVLDPKGDAAEAAISLVPRQRARTLLDLSRPALNGVRQVSFDSLIAGGEVLVVKGALGAMGAGNTRFWMQSLLEMLDAALARRQGDVARHPCTAVALKVDDAPLVLNRELFQMIALRRSAGLETVACWQADSQWADRDVRAQLDALFAHRVYFATTSVEDARRAAKLTMAQLSDVVRPDIRNLSALGRPDVRLHLPRHSAIASWVTPEGRQAPFVARTIRWACPPRTPPDQAANIDHRDSLSASETITTKLVQPS